MQQPGETCARKYCGERNGGPSANSAAAAVKDGAGVYLLKLLLHINGLLSQTVKPVMRLRTAHESVTL